MLPTDHFHSTSSCLQDSDIAWHYDRDHLYGHYLATNYNNIPPFRGGNTTTTYIDESQHLMVWMRPSVHSTVRKLYGVINEEIPAGGLKWAQGHLYCFIILGHPDNALSRGSILDSGQLQHSGSAGVVPSDGGGFVAAQLQNSSKL